jgi:hypothetical protein
MTGLVTIEEIMRRVFGSEESPGPLNRCTISGQSRGVRGLPAWARPLVYETEATQEWQRRVRRWHTEQRNKNADNWHPFFRMIGRVQELRVRKDGGK